jgi:hypothetical protein
LAAERGLGENLMSTNILNIGKYLIDSAKFYIDKDKFDEVLIPENFTLTDSDTGELIDEFKKSSLAIPYKNHKIYISNVVKQLGTEGCKTYIDKVLIYFPAKISDNYFNGISKEDFIGVLEYIRSKGYLKFNDIEKILGEFYVKDLDIKLDLKLKIGDRLDIKEYNGNLKDRFNGNDDDCKLFDSKKQGFGIQCWKRESASITKPFFKFYDKSKEIKKDLEFFNKLPISVKDELINNFVYRFEFTMKDSSFFKKYGISNKLINLFEVTQDKWKEIGRSFIDYAFNKVVRPSNIGRIKPKDRIGVNIIWALYQKFGATKGQILSIYTSAATNKSEKYKNKKAFNRLWAIATTPSEYTAELIANLERIEKWDRYFGLL